MCQGRLPVGENAQAYLQFEQTLVRKGDVAWRSAFTEKDEVRKESCEFRKF